MTWVARVAPLNDDRFALRSPEVGYFTSRVEQGQELIAGDVLGIIDVLNVRSTVTVPEGALGVVEKVLGSGPVDYATDLAVLRKALHVGSREGVVESGGKTGELVYCSPMSGRFYRRASPGERPFIAEGEDVRSGDLIGLLEVMKTFNRLTYGGPHLPAQAKVVRILAADGADLSLGEPILAVEPAD